MREGLPANEEGRINAKLAWAGLAAITAFATYASYVEPSVSASADLNQADTSASIHKIVWDQSQDITPATVYFTETLDAQNIQEHIVVRPLLGHGPDVMPDPTVNKQLDGAGQEVFQLPFSAISQHPDAQTGKVNLSIDLSQVKGNIAWSGAGAEVKDYTLSGGKKNFQDRSGFINSLVGAVGDNMKVVNLDTLGNTVDDLNAKIDHDMKLKGLDVFGTCNRKPELVKKLESFADQAVRANAAMMGRTDIGKISFVNEQMGFNIDTGDRAAAVTGDSYEHSYQLPSGNFHVDKLDCNVNSQETAN